MRCRGASAWPRYSWRPSGSAAVTETTPVDDPEAYRSDLEALGYLSSVDAGDAAAGVTLHDPERVAPGLVVFSSQLQKKAFPLDADGTAVHT